MRARRPVFRSKSFGLTPSVLVQFGIWILLVISDLFLRASCIMHLASWIISLYFLWTMVCWLWTIFCGSLTIDYIELISYLPFTIDDSFRALRGCNLSFVAQYSALFSQFPSTMDCRLSFSISNYLSLTPSTSVREGMGWMCVVSESFYWGERKDWAGVRIIAYKNVVFVIEKCFSCSPRLI